MSPNAMDMVDATGIAGRDVRPAAQCLFFSAKEKAPKERRPHSQRPFAALRATCAAGLLAGSGSNSLRSDNRQPFSAKNPASQAHGEGEIRAHRRCALAQSANGARAPSPLYAPRSAASSGSGLALFERSEFSQTPLEASTAGCPQRSVGTQTVGSPFLGLLSFGEAKESDCAAGRTSRPRMPINTPKRQAK
ncbi:hypothetical protein os1_14210 [Comamonadaceae bacterium OS-1]|nr:hypothetical protein os1_14210 [Comamonadaceae bacterium OS-1]